MVFSSWDHIILQAKQDLKILETHHPNRFEYLKHELKSFISFLESQQMLLPSSQQNELVSTQESTCDVKNEKGTSGSFEIQETKEERKCSRQKEFQKLEEAVELKMEKDRVDKALEKAQSCLQKIQELKASLLC